MSEETTQDMTARSFEERIFARFDGMEARLGRMETRLDGMEVRLTSLEEKVDARLREPRPIWEAMKVQLDRLESKLDVVAADLLETRTDYAVLGKRVVRLEERERPPAV